MVRNGLGQEADFLYWECYEGPPFGKLGFRNAKFSEGAFRSYGPIAQLDRVTDFYSVGCRFESCWDRQLALSATVRRPPSPSPAIWIASRSPCTTGTFSFPQFPLPSTCARLDPPSSGKFCRYT